MKCDPNEISFFLQPKMDFDKTLKVCLFALERTLAHPETPRDMKWLLKFTTAFGIYSIMAFVISFNIYYELINDDFLTACKNGILVLSCLAVAVNYTILLWHRGSIKKLMHAMRSDIELFKELPAEEQELVKKYSKKQSFVCKQWLVICICAALMFHVQALASMVYFYFIGDFKLVPLYDLLYPSIIEEWKETFIVYLSMYILVSYCSLLSVINYMALSPLAPAFMLHACARLELIRTRLEKLYTGEESRVNERLNSIAKELQDTYSFVSLIQISFKLYYELVLKLSTFLLPFTLYLFLELARRGEFSLEFMTFMFTGSVTSGIPCYYSNMLMEKGEGVRLAAYSCGWESHYHLRVRTSLPLILIRTLRPIAIRTIFRTVSLVALSEVFQQSYAIFSLMNAVLD